MSRRQRRRPSGLRPRFEPLEPRCVLNADALVSTNDAYLRLSFAGDGVSAAGQASALHATLNALAPEAVWKEGILRAFQTWATLTNADIGVVGDGGQPFGAPGATFGDPRFGDIRIGAIAMDPSIGAVSVPVTGAVGGSWLGDVLINTEFPYQDIDEVFAVALHEAGNVFGLLDNNDPASPLHAGTIPTATSPTPADVAALEALYGPRAEDANETTGGNGGGHPPDNNSFANAARIVVSEPPGLPAGSTPSLLYGDLAPGGDVDYFLVRNTDSYTGPLTFELRTSGVSLLTPRLRVYGDNEQLLQTATSTGFAGDRLTVTLPSSLRERDYYVVVDAAPGGAFDAGGYSLSVRFDTINLLDPALLESYANGSLRRLTAEQLAKVLDPANEDLVDDDEQQNETFGTAFPLEPDPAFANGGRFERVGAISAAGDVDYYAIQSPNSFGSGAGSLTLAVRSLDAGGLIPRVRLLDEDGIPAPVTVLLNGGGEVVVQADAIEAGKEYFVSVEAAGTLGAFATGNYQLTAVFHNDATTLQSFASGVLAPADYGKEHTFYVAEPQLFHFALDAGPGAGVAAVVATLHNASGQALHRIAAPLGETRSSGAVFLAPGEYRVRFSTASLYAPLTAPVTYELRGRAISDPFAADPDDPANHPFACMDPELTGFFCYPGNIISADPYLWDDFVNSLTSPPPPLDLQPLVTLLMGDWWSWVWGQMGANGPVLAQGDQFPVSTAPPGGPAGLTSGARNVLTNDIDPEHGAVVAVLSSSTSHGALTLAPDGAITYTPDPGFTGTDHFTYTAYDFHQFSNPATVHLVVGSGVPGDYDASGVADVTDHTAWSASFGSDSELLADGNGDGIVNIADYVVWRDAVGAPPAPFVAPQVTAGPEAPPRLAALLEAPAALPGEGPVAGATVTLQRQGPAVLERADAGADVVPGGLGTVTTLVRSLHDAAFASLAKDAKAARRAAPRPALAPTLDPAADPPTLVQGARRGKVDSDPLDHGLKPVTTAAPAPVEGLGLSGAVRRAVRRWRP